MARRVRFILGHHIWGLQSPGPCQENNAPRADDGSSVGAGPVGMIFGNGGAALACRSLKSRRRPKERGSGGPCRVSLLIFEPEGIIVSVKLDSCYRSFSTFSAPEFKPWHRAPRLPVPRGTRRQTPAPWPVYRRCPSAAKNPKGNFPPCKALKNHKMEKESHPSPAKKTHGTDGSKTRGSAETISPAAARGHRRGISRMRGVERPPFDEGCGIWGASRACIWFPADPPPEYPTRKSDAESPPAVKRKPCCGRRTAGSVGAVAGSSRAK